MKTMPTLNLDPNNKYLLACSFGPDSMALFYLLEQAKISFDVAIVNYHLRKESDSEVDGLSSYCKNKNIKLFIHDVKEEIGHSNIEEKCRIIRYQFFAKLVKENGYAAVLVAHHQDDLLETYFLQKQRKTYVKHYGILQNTVIFGVPIMRPLLTFSKNDLLKICEDNNVPYMIDKSNLEDRFSRNKIRHQIVSKLSTDEREKLLNEIYFENLKISQTIFKLNALNLSDAETLNMLNDFELTYALFMLLEEAGLHSSLSYKLVKEIRKILVSKKSNIVFPINKRLCLLKEYGKISFGKNDIKSLYYYVIDAPTLIDNDYFYLDFRKESKNRNVDIKDYPLVIRPAKSGDTYQIKDYVCKINRLYIDWKMPVSLRKRWPVIINKNNVVIYVPRYQPDFVPNDATNFYVK